MKNEIIIQISSGRGPAECCWVVSQTLKTIIMEASDKKIEIEIVDSHTGTELSTLSSVILRLEGCGVDDFIASWIGTVQWIGQSPFRKLHKRKNWFIGINSINKDEASDIDENEISFQTMRASGPGGQHVNKTETAVRAIHRPSGIQVTSSDSRSQLQNKKLAIERLRQKVKKWQNKEISVIEQNQWNLHNTIKRGNPVRVFGGMEFKAVANISICLIFIIL